MQNNNSFMVGLVDCNNFFVSCERVNSPELIGKAVVVLSNNDGCAIARSNEAKALGVKMGQPAFQFRDLIISGKLIALSSNHKLYHEISVKVHAIFRRFVPATFDYSVDEAFLNVDGIPNSALLEIAEQIRDTCLLEEKIPVTVGFSYTRTLAKIATHIGKKKLSSVCILDDKQEIRRIIEELPIYELWGIGRRLSRRLYSEGINTIADFADQSIQYIRNNYGINGERIWNELHSVPCVELKNRNIQDSLSETRTFPFNTDNFEFIRSRVIMFAADCAARLRRMNGLCKVVSVNLSTNRFKESSEYPSLVVNICFEAYESSTSMIVKAAEQGLMKIFEPSQKYKRAGVTLSSIINANNKQRSLFDQDEENFSSETENLMNVIDNINNEIKDKPMIKLASQLSDGLSATNSTSGYTSTFHFQE